MCDLFLRQIGRFSPLSYEGGQGAAEAFERVGHATIVNLGRTLYQAI